MQPSFRVAYVQVFYQRASVYDAQSETPLFLVDLSIPGGNGRIQRGCERRGYEVPQVRTNARGALRLQKRLPGRAAPPEASAGRTPFTPGRRRRSLEVLSDFSKVASNALGALQPAFPRSRCLLLS
jgi:hypothetical protein